MLICAFGPCIYVSTQGHVHCRVSSALGSAFLRMPKTPPQPHRKSLNVRYHTTSLGVGRPPGCAGRGMPARIRSAGHHIDHCGQRGPYTGTGRTPFWRMPGQATLLSCYEGLPAWRAMRQWQSLTNMASPSPPHHPHTPTQDKTMAYEMDFAPFLFRFSSLPCCQLRS